MKELVLLKALELTLQTSRLATMSFLFIHLNARSAIIAKIRRPTCVKKFD